MSDRKINWTPSPDEFGIVGRVLERAVEVLTGALLLFLMVLTCTDVIGRYVFLAPVPGAAEIIALSMGVLIFLALPMVSARGSHISITFLDSVVPQALRRAHYLIIQLISVAALAFLAWRIYAVADYLGTVNETTTFLGLPKAPVAYALAVLAGLSALLNGLVLAASFRSPRLPRA